jgi:replication factor A2
LFNTRGPPDGTKPAHSFNNPSQAMDEIITANSTIGKSGGDFSNLDPLQRQIMTLVHNAPPSNEGVHVQTIAQTIRAPSASILQAVEQLATEGLLYTTIDDDHVLAPDLLTANNS